jgi:hypothetical protein
MRRHASWVPALAAPIAVLGHIVSESLASGRALFSVACEPTHTVILLLAVAATPLWFRAAASRRLGHALFAFIALSLLLEGNGLGAAAMLVALVISAFISCLSAVALERAFVAREGAIKLGDPPRVCAALPARLDLTGPYYAFIPVRGNRPPPLLLAQPAISYN